MTTKGLKQQLLKSRLKVSFRVTEMVHSNHQLLQSSECKVRENEKNKSRHVLGIEKTKTYTASIKILLEKKISVSFRSLAVFRLDIFGSFEGNQSFFPR